MSERRKEQAERIVSMRLIGLYSKKIYLEAPKEADLHRLMNQQFTQKIKRPVTCGYDEYIIYPEPMVIRRGGGQGKGERYEKLYRTGDRRGSHGN